MRKFILIINCLTVALLGSVSLMAQTTVFPYSGNSVLSTSSCNVFNPSVSITGYQHNSRAGAVLFSSSAGLELGLTQSGSTAFYISYPFYPGYTYNISVTASSLAPASIRCIAVTYLQTAGGAIKPFEPG